MHAPERISHFAPFLDLPTIGEHENIRTMLHFSQSDIALSPETGLAYALRAAQRGQQPDQKVSDDTAEGEAWGKASLHFPLVAVGSVALGSAEIIEGTAELIDHSKTSLQELGTRKANRELIATHILAGRSYMNLAHLVSGSQEHHDELLRKAADELDAGKVCLLAFARHSIPARDPYATMLLHWSAVNERLRGNNRASWRNALFGVSAAIIASPEDANHDPNLLNAIRFKGKQVAQNLLAPLSK